MTEITPEFSSLEHLLTPYGAAHVNLLRSVAKELDRRKYTFASDDEFVRGLTASIPDGMKVYWRDVLQHAHWAAAITVLRTERWLHAAAVAAAAGNLFGFCAAVRGFLESAADSSDALIDIPLWLAAKRATFQHALRGGMKTIQTWPDIEQRLEHFTYARKIQKGEVAPDSHRAKTTRDYIRRLDHAGNNTVGDIYAWLCEITHPAMTSVEVFATPLEVGNTVLLTNGQDGALIAAFCEMHSSEFRDMLFLGINPALLTFKILNRFEIPNVTTRAVDHLAYGALPAWQDIHTAWQSSTHQDADGGVGQPNPSEV